MPSVSLPSVSLRPLTDEEYAGYRPLAVAKTVAELVRGRGMPPEVARQRAEDGLPATLADLLAVEGASISRVLGDSGDPVGWLWLGTATAGGDGLWVFDVEIDEPYRGQGLGRATMRAAEEAARDRGFSVLRLNVFGSNTTAAALYRSLDFQVDAAQLSKRLDDPPR